MLKHHKWKLFFVGMGANLALIASLAVADLKVLAEINWLDVLSEGGAAMLALVWLGLILHSRPAGRVTQYLSLGLSGIFLAGFQDLLDEFIRFPEATRWDHWIESGCMPIGLVLLTLGIFHWHKEQLSINEQLRKRERLFREHRCLDFTTNLSGADYLRKQLLQALPEHRNAEQSLALLFIDVDNFREINRRYGHQQGDHLLQSLSELMLLNIRRSDVLCRYAGDRFALILPNTGRVGAEQMASELSAAVQHFAYKTHHEDQSLFQSVSIGIAVASSDLALADSVETLIERATISLLHAKEKSHDNLHRAA
ncbi:GGDEF domain-containing protein [Cellvibrio sp.]